MNRLQSKAIISLALAAMTAPALTAQNAATAPQQVIMKAAGEGTTHENPYTAKEGINTVPAAAGTYWFEVTVDRQCKIHISSTDALKGGEVSLWLSSWGISYGSSPDFISETGSFELVAGVSFANTYIFSVSKSNTDNDLRFILALEDYPAGEIKDNPIVLTPPENQTVPHSDGEAVKRYYAVNVAADSKAAFLTLKSDLAEDPDSYSNFEIAQEGSYSTTQGKSNVRVKVQPSGKYIITASNYETTDINFSVSLDEPSKGDFFTDPLAAAEGTNSIPGTGEKYFKYTAKTTGKLQVTVSNPAINVKFPKDEQGYDTYPATRRVNDYIINATAGNDYYICVSKFNEGDSFELVNEEFKPGEDKSTAIEVTDKFDLGGNALFSWIKYTAPQSGVVTISSDLSYNSVNTLEYMLNDDTSMENLATSTYVDGSYTYKYEATKIVEEGTVIYLKINIAEPQPGGYSISFAIADPQPGQTAGTPIVLEKDKTVEFNEVDYDSPMWCKISAKPGTIRLYFSDYVSFDWFRNIDDAKADTNGEWGTPSTEDPDTPGFSYYEVTVTEPGEHYIRLNRSYGPFRVYANGNGIKVSGGDSYTNAFIAVEGANTVPADEGTFWYKIVSDRNCRLKITSDSPLPDGQVCFYNSEYSIEYGGEPDYTSETGSFNLTANVSEKTYYFSISKSLTDTDLTFSLDLVDYEPGEVESNPIELTPPADSAAKAAVGENCTYTYFSIKVPAMATETFLTIKVTNPDALVSGKTEFALTPEGEYYGETGYDYIRVEATPGKKYKLVAYNYETTDIQFSVSLDEAQPGDLITDPLEAVFGTNTITGEGRTKFYKATAATTGKFELTPAEGIEVTFPKGTDKYAGNHEATLVGNRYILPVTEGTEYLICLNNVNDGDTFDLANAEFQPGEDKSTAELIEESYTTTNEPVLKWFKYIPAKSGILTIASDMAYDRGVSLQYMKEGETSLTDIVTSSYEDGSYINKYTISMPAEPTDVIYVRLLVNVPQPGSLVTFTLADPEPGQTLGAPIELNKDIKYDFNEVTYDSPIWCKVSVIEGTYRIYASDYISFDIYRDYESAKNETESEWGSPSQEDVELGMSYYEVTVTTAGEHYIKLGRSYGPFSLFVTGDAIPNLSGITGIDANAAEQIVDVYDMSGKLVCMGANLADLNLPAGIYIFKYGDKIEKVVVK